MSKHPADLWFIEKYIICVFEHHFYIISHWKLNENKENSFDGVEGKLSSVCRTNKRPQNTTRVLAKTSKKLTWKMFEICRDRISENFNNKKGKPKHNAVLAKTGFDFSLRRRTVSFLYAHRIYLLTGKESEKWWSVPCCEASPTLWYHPVMYYTSTRKPINSAIREYKKNHIRSTDSITLFKQWKILVTK